MLKYLIDFFTDILQSKLTVKHTESNYNLEIFEMKGSVFPQQG